MTTNDQQQPTDAAALRVKLIEKIKKLQRMTVERGASETEAMRAAQVVQQLISEHNIEQSELEIRTDAKNCAKDSYTAIRSSKPAWSNLAIAIEKLYGTIAWAERSSEDLLGLGFETETYQIVYYGFPVDVAGSIATLAICAIALDTAVAALPKRSKKIERESFEIGMTDRLQERIKEMRLRAHGEAKGQGALVVLKDKLVQEEFSKLGVKLYRSHAPERKISPAGYVAGRAAANAVNLGTNISSNGQRRIS